ncbi:uncharacterized protein V1516DRAFT_672757 [Lipomyces oligophaga]|uniref:uncharacterized protein n=1 Tax=Lipomyces oligophaga TaxID=45792 RepID=UPI0034CF9C9A
MAPHFRLTPCRSIFRPYSLSRTAVHIDRPLRTLLFEPTIFSRPFSSTFKRHAIDPTNSDFSKLPTSSHDEREQLKRERAKKRAASVLSKIPPSLRPLAEKILSAPTSYIVMFLLLHEVSAVLPLFLLMWLFQLTDWLPHLPDELIETGREFYKKNIPNDSGLSAEQTSQLLIQGGTAYAIVKILLPLRVLLCVVATPWMVRHSIDPIKQFLKLYKAKPTQISSGKESLLQKMPPKK